MLRTTILSSVGLGEERVKVQMLTPSPNNRLEADARKTRAAQPER